MSMPPENNRPRGGRDNSSVGAIIILIIIIVIILFIGGNWGGWGWGKGPTQPPQAPTTTEIPSRINPGTVSGSTGTPADDTGVQK
jgi:hypothetical protein